MTASDLQCIHGVNARFGCEKCARIERRMMAIPTVALMAATVRSVGFTNKDAADVAWGLYEDVCKRCAE